MTVFKGFMTLVKRNLLMLFLYLGIFMSICIMIQVMTKGEGMNHFEEESLDVAVIDRDGGVLAKGLAVYLGQKHHLTEMEDDAKVIQEKLFYRDVYYVVTIPEDFEEKCLESGEPLKTVKIPGAFTAYYVDQQIDTFLNDVRVFKAAGFSTEEAVNEAIQIGGMDTEVTLIDKNGHGGQMAPHAYMFQYLPYMIISVLCYIIGFVMFAYKKKDVRRRILCSAVSFRRQNFQLAAAYLVMGAVLWGICMLLPVILYGRDFLTDGNLVYYLLNSAVFTLVSLSMAFLIGVLVNHEEVINGVVNVISLGMSFTCGVFVSMSVLGRGVRMFARFLPVYWYEIVNEIVGNNAQFTAAQKTAVFQGMGIQLLFAAALLAAGLAVSKYKEQE